MVSSQSTVRPGRSMRRSKLAERRDAWRDRDPASVLIGSSMDRRSPYSPGRRDRGNEREHIPPTRRARPQTSPPSATEAPRYPAPPHPPASSTAPTTVARPRSKGRVPGSRPDEGDRCRRRLNGRYWTRTSDPRLVSPRPTSDDRRQPSRVPLRRTSLPRPRRAAELVSAQRGEVSEDDPVAVLLREEQNEPCGLRGGGNGEDIEHSAFHVISGGVLYRPSRKPRRGARTIARATCEPSWTLEAPADGRATERGRGLTRRTPRARSSPRTRHRGECRPLCGAR